jgi:hypothetical protein
VAGYAWVITQDLNNPYGEDSSLDLPTRVGLSGPSAATAEDILRALDHGEFFRLVDDDGNPYYIGRCWCADGPGSPEMFVPLDDWGRADVGATEVQYRSGGGWKSL